MMTVQNVDNGNHHAVFMRFTWNTLDYACAEYVRFCSAAIANADFADGLDGWTYSNVTADACGPQTVANFSSAGAWLEQDVGAVAGDEYVVSFRYHPFACGLAPGYGSYPWSVSVSIGDATASTNGSYAPWAAWQGMSNFTFRLRPSVPGPLRIAVGGMPNPVVTHVAVTRLAHSSRAFVWGLDLSGTLQGAGGVGGLLVQRHSGAGTPLFPFFDVGGNVTDVYSDIARATYHCDPYGTLMDCESNCLGNMIYGCKILEMELQLYYYDYRWYLPKHGQFITRDPCAELGFVTLSCEDFHLTGASYGYSMNNPMNGWDYLGLQASLEQDFCKILCDVPCDDILSFIENLEKTRDTLQQRLYVVSDWNELTEGMAPLGQNWIFGGGVTEEGKHHLTKWQRKIVEKIEKDKGFTKKHSDHPSVLLIHDPRLYAQMWGEAEVDRMSDFIDILRNVYEDFCGNEK